MLWSAYMPDLSHENPAAARFTGLVTGPGPGAGRGGGAGAGAAAGAAPTQDWEVTTRNKQRQLTGSILTPTNQHQIKICTFRLTDLPRP